MSDMLDPKVPGQSFSGFPPELQAEQQSIARRRAIADMLLQQSMTPTPTQMAGRVAIRNSPFQGFSRLTEAGVGAHLTNRADSAETALQGKYKTGLAEALQNYQSGTAPHALPESQSASGGVDQYGAPAMPEMVAPSPEQRRQKITTAMVSNYAPVRDIAKMDLGAVERQETQKMQQDFLDRQHTQSQAHLLETKKYEIDARARAKLDEISAAATERRISKEEADIRAKAVREEADARHAQLAKELKAMGIAVAGSNMRAVPTAVADPQDPNKTIIVDANKPATVIGQGPKLTDTGKLENKRQFNMQGLGQTLQEAEDLLTGKGGKALPTGSGMGTVVDYVGGLVGANPSGAKEAQTLKAIGGALVSKMPRMEGPQSDKDVMLYKEMAGVVGDSTIPRERRVAALEKVKELWGKYERLNPEVFSDRRGGPPPGAVERLP